MIRHFTKTVVLPAIMLLVLCAGTCFAALAPEVAQRVQKNLMNMGDANPPGKILFSEDFKSGNQDKWTVSGDWTFTSDSDGSACVKVVSGTGYVNLITRLPINVNPRHAIGLSYKSRRLSGDAPLFIRIDAQDENGGFLLASQNNFGESSNWTSHNILLNDWIPAEASTITLNFFLDGNVDTSTLLKDVRVIDLTPNLEQEIVARVREYTKSMSQLKSNIDSKSGKAFLKEWYSSLSEVFDQAQTAVDSAVKADPATAAFQDKVSAAGMWVDRLTDITSGLKDGRVQTRKFAVYSAYPITNKTVLPDRDMLPGKKLGIAQVNACPGETESASLVLWSPSGASNVLPKASVFTGPAGKLQPSACDIKWVKCWYQAGGAPYSVAVSSGRSLVAELLLNDDNMVVVDRASKTQTLKLHYSNGVRYVPISEDKKTPTDWGIETPGSFFPVKDSNVLLPSDIPACENKQIWLTFKVPANAKPGKYTGSISFTSGKEKLGSVKVVLNVLPFKLPAPKTSYNLTKGYTGSLYYWGILSKKPQAMIGFRTKNLVQFTAEIKSMADHNIIAPAMILGPDVIYKDHPLFRKMLGIMKKYGMSGRPLYIADSSLIGNNTDPAKLAVLKTNITNAIKVAKEFGFTGIYFYGIDEAQGDVLKSERIAWNAAHEAGAKVWVSGWGNMFSLVGDVLDQANWAGDAKLAQIADWHKNGHTVWNYANPQTPIEDAEMYRRNYGLYNWKLGIDGTCTYCYMDSSGTQWNDWDGHVYRDHCIAYPTVNGVVGTLAFEGLREALDDVKYATKLMQLIDKQKNGPKKAAAEDARKFLNNMDTVSGDLNQIHAEMIKRILQLM